MGREKAGKLIEILFLAGLFSGRFASIT